MAAKVGKGRAQSKRSSIGQVRWIFDAGNFEWGVLVRVFFNCWRMNFFDAAPKIDAGADENHDINFQRPYKYFAAVNRRCMAIMTIYRKSWTTKYLTIASTGLNNVPEGTAWNIYRIWNGEYVYLQQPTSKVTVATTARQGKKYHYVYNSFLPRIHSLLDYVILCFRMFSISKKYTYI